MESTYNRSVGTEHEHTGSNFQIQKFHLEMSFFLQGGADERNHRSHLRVVAVRGALQGGRQREAGGL